MRSKLLTLVTFTLLLSSLSACHGILDELYDEPSDEVTLKEGQLYVDASSWTDWYYIDLTDAKKEFVRKEIPTEATDSLHRVSPPPLGAGGLYTYWYDVFGEGISKHEFRGFTPTDKQSEPESCQ